MLMFIVGVSMATTIPLEFFTILTLLSPNNSDCDKYTRLINLSRNSAVECLLDQPSENRAETKKDFFIKGRQETLDDVLTFLANVFVFSHFWVRMDIDETTSYPFVVQLLVEVVDILSSVEYRKFTGKFVGGYENMSHTLIAYVFKILSLFVKAAKTPVVTRHTKACNVLEMKHL